MSLYIPELIIDSITIPFSASQEMSQSYTPLEAKYVVRTGNGSAIIRTAWTGKLSTSIQGQGVIPANLAAFDWSTTHTLYCIAPRSVGGTTNPVILVPKARRIEGTVDSNGVPTGPIAYARAIMSYHNDWVYTTFTIDDEYGGPLEDTHDEFTLVTVEDALQYQVVYYPKLTVICNPPEESVSADAFFSWSLDAEEV